MHYKLKISTFEFESKSEPGREVAKKKRLKYVNLVVRTHVYAKCDFVCMVFSRNVMWGFYHHHKYTNLH